jgi:hypothetical protein
VLTLVLDSSLLNSFFIYQADAKDVGMLVYSWQLWHFTLGKRLVAPFMRQDVAQGPAQTWHGVASTTRSATTKLAKIALSMESRLASIALGVEGSLCASMFAIPMHILSHNMMC